MALPPFTPPGEPRPASADHVGPVPPAGWAVDLAWYPEEQDALDALAATRDNQRTKNLLVSLAIGVAAAAVGVLTGELTLVGFGVLVPVLSVYGDGPGRTKAVRSAWRASPALQAFREVRVSPDGVTERFPGFVGTSSWPRYSRVIETERLFILVAGDLAGTNVQLLPKRGLPAGVGPEAFGATLRAMLGQAPGS